MNTYFIRHTEVMSIDSNTFEQLWLDRKIAIPFPSDKHGIPDATKDNESLIRLLKEGIDWAKSNNHKQAEMSNSFP